MAKLGLQQSPLEAALQQAESVSYGLPDDLKKQFEQDRIKAESRRKNTDQQYDARVLDLSSRNAAVTGGATWDSKLTGSTSFIKNNPDVFAGYSPQQMHWIAAISAQESAGNPNARSPVGAFGLMQVMPATGQNPGYGIKPLRDSSVRENVRLGLGKFEAMMSRFNGDVDKALAAYNAGEGNVDKAVARARKFGGDWKAYLPRPQETIPYINNVKGYYNAIGSKGGVPTSAAQPAPTKQATTADSRYRPLSDTELKRMQEAQAQGLDTFVPFAGAKPIKIGQQPGKKAPKQENEDAGFLSDTGNLLLSGVNSSVEALHEIAGRMPGISIGASALDKIEEYFTGKTPQQIFKEVDEKYNKKLSNETAEARKKRWIIEPGDDLGNGKKATEYSFGDAWKDPRAYYAGIVESAPEMVATMGGSLTLAKGAFKAALKSGATREVASKKAATTATIAGGILEGGFGGAHAAIDVRKEIKGMSADILKNSEAMKALMAEGKTFEQARNQLADDAATKAFVVAGVGTGIFGGMGDRAIAQVITKGTSSRLKSAVGSAIGEGLLEEAPQSAAQQMAQNYAVQDADPNRSLMKGVANQAAGGAVLGGIMGGGIGAAGHRGGVEPVPAEQTAEEVPQAAAEAPVQDAVPEQLPRNVGPLERALGGEESLNTAIDNEIAAVAADQWLGAPGTVTKISPKADPESVYTVTVEGYENGEVFARDQDGTPMQFSQGDVNVAQPTSETITPAAQVDATEQAPTERRDGTTDIIKGGMTIVHGSGNDKLSFDDIKIIRTNNQKQGKKGRVYGGFYGTSEVDSAQADGYASMMGGSPTLYDVKIKAGTKVLKKTGDVTRLSENYINELVAQGYGVVVGKDPRGRTEYVVIDKNAIESMNARPGKNTGTEQGHAPELTDLDYTPKRSAKAQHQVEENQKPPTTADAIKHGMAEISRGMDEGARNQVAEYIREGNTDRLTYRKEDAINAALSNPNYNVQRNDDGSVTVIGVKTADGAWHGVSRSDAQPASSFKDQILDAHVNNPAKKAQIIADEIKATGRTRSDVFGEVSRIVDEYEANKPQTEAQPVAQTKTEATTETPAPLMGADGKPKWFFSRDKAEAFITKKKLGDQYQVNEVSKNRFEIHPIAAATQETAPFNVAPSVVEMATEKPIRTYGFDRVKMANNLSLEELDQLKRQVEAEHANPRNEQGQYLENGQPSLSLYDKKGLKKLDDISWAVYHKTKNKDGDQANVSKEADKIDMTAERIDADNTEPKQKTKAAPSANTLVSDDRAAELRARLKAKLTQLNSGIDPEIMAIGAELAVYHIERGARKFAAFAQNIAADLDVSMDKVRPYLRSWYNGARDMMEDMGGSIEGMDDAETVRAELAKLDQVPAAEQTQAPAPKAAPTNTGKTETVTTPAGREFEVRHKVVEADDLITSNTGTGAINPDYPQQLQPRDRSRAASQNQINEIASKLNPRLLGENVSAAEGAPIVSADNIVESGNGRTLAIRKAYERGLADDYRNWLAEQGYDVEGMKMPVLVRERTTPMSMEERTAYTKEANERTTLELSPAERAAMDAQKVGPILYQFKGGDIDSSLNRPFVRAFIDEVVSISDRGGMLEGGGQLSQAGKRRIQAALLAKAYDDESLVTDMFESVDSDIKAIGGAMLDVAGEWASMRDGVQGGTISSSVDLTPNLMEAVNIVRRARAEGRSVFELVNQDDIFAGEIDPVTRGFVSVFYRGESLTRARGRDKVAGALRDYAQQALNTTPGENLFGDPEINGSEILRNANERLQNQEADKQQDIFAGPSANEQDAREPGGSRPGPGTETANETPAETAAEVSTAPERPALPKTAQLGPLTIKPKPIGKTLYRETNSEGLDTIIRASYTNGNGDTTQMFVADNVDLAIGQGENKGVLIQFRGEAVAGTEHKKPGTGDITGREYKTEYLGLDAVDQMIIAADVRMRPLTRNLVMRNFDREVLPNGDRLFRRKGYDVGQPLNEIRGETAPAAAPKNPFQKYHDVAQQYGRSVNEKGEILGKNGKPTGVRIVEKKQRIRIERIEGNQLLFTAAKPEGIGKFLEDYWFDKKLAKPAEAKAAAPAPSQDKAENPNGPHQMTIDGRRVDGGPIIPGHQFITSSGRLTTPYPKQKSEKYASQWLIDNAVAEAEARGDRFNTRIFSSYKPMKNGELSTADREGMLMYLYGEQPAVVPSILKDDLVEDRNVSSTAERVERNRQEPATTEPVNAPTNGNDETADAAGTGTAGQDTDGEPGAGQRDQRISTDGTVAGRERGDQRVHRDDGQFEPTQRPAGDTERTGGGIDGGTGSTVEQQRANDVVKNAQAAGTSELDQRLAAQAKADKTPTKWGDKASIDVALPLLLDPQRDDVLKAENRLSQDNGILFTNGTGTGKTATGMGVAKRYINAGKDNIIIVVPSDKIAADWVKFAKMLNVEVKQLADSSSNGDTGPIVTTYANFGQNPSLVNRKWDLIITDESHYLSSNEKGDGTAALEQLRALTGHHAGFYAYVKQKYAKELAALDKARQAGPRGPDVPADRIAKLQDAEDKALKAWQEIQDRERPKWEARWEKQQDIPKVVMLSATPFAYVKNTDYAEGYLFHYVPPAELKQSLGQGRGYNQGGPREQFMMQHFGYRMRTGKLTAPDAGVNSQLLEQNFNQWLKDQGALSGRRLDVPFDYDRKFVLVDDAVGTKIDNALKYLHKQSMQAQAKASESNGDENAKKQAELWSNLYDAVNGLFDYQSRMYLLEAIKAKAAIPMIQKHIDLGRKVVVFHDYNKGGGFDPFRAAMGKAFTADQKAFNKNVFDSRPDLFNLDLTDLVSPIEALTKAFPQALEFNGTISKANRRANADKFNKDNSEHNIIIVQSDAGREGVSLHDTSGVHQRVEINLGMPVKPVAATQIEGRIYRTGQASNAIFRYLTTGTGWESAAFSRKIAERASTAENLALGLEARGLKESFIDAYQNADIHEPGEADGLGGKEYDRSMSASNAITPFDKAKTFYWAQQKNTKSRGQREGADYYATPEPVGFKMVEFADIKTGNKVLEPSAGHGAIARWFPDQTDVTMVEPSYDLAQRAGLANGTARIINDTFENLHVTNKYDAIVMNPPYGNGGKISTDHLAKAATHLRDGGRIVALLPRGGMADNRLAGFLNSEEAKDLYVVARINMPSSTFERAGTSVNTQILVLEKHKNERDATGITEKRIDLSNAKDVNELFDRMEDLTIEPRKESTSLESKYEIVEHVTQNGKVLRGIIRTDIDKFKAQQIDPYAFRKKNEDGKQGWFIRERWLTPDVKFSRSDTTGTGTTVEQVRTALADRFGEKTIAELEKSGILTIVEAYDVPGVEGYSQGGKVTLVANALTSDTIVPVFLHELGGHVGMQGVMQPETYQKLMDQFNRLVKAKDPIALEAKRLAERETDPTAQEYEYLPYLITVAAREQKKRPGIRTLINRIVAAVKAWAFEKFGVNINLNANDVLALAERMVNTIGKASSTGSRRFSQVDTPRSEINAVRKQYEGTDEWMKAPNGKPTNLNEQQWLQVRTPSFKNWFGDWENDLENASKVVDENGEPMVVYHGSRNSFTAFDASRLSENTGNDGHYGAGMYFSLEKAEAETYGKNIISAFLNIKAPVRNSIESLEPFAEQFGYEKEFKTVDKNWLAGEIKKKDPNAGILASLYADGYTFDNVWPEFEKRGGKYQSEINLDEIGDVFENIDNSIGYYSREFIEETIGEIPEDKKIYGYENEPDILDITDRGNAGRSFSNTIQKAGHDGVIAGSEFVVFKPEQIKSATDNVGTFDGANRDIRFSRRDEDLAPVSEQEYASKLSQWWSEAKKLPSDKLTKLMTDGGLGLIPLRPMLTEMAKDIPAATSYLRIKDAMDAMRNKWHAKTDAVAQEWLKYRIKNKEENRELMDLMHESTLNQVDPSMPFQSLMTPKERMALQNPNLNANLRLELTAKMELDAKREEAYDVLKSRYDSLSSEAQSLYKSVRDTYTDLADAFDETLLKNMEKAINVRVKKAEREHSREMERITDEGLQGQERDDAIAAADRRLKNAKTKIAWNRKARMTQLRKQFETQRLAGPYFPLARFGNLFVTVRDAKSGEVVSFSRFEDPTEQRQFAEEMRKDKNYKVEEGALIGEAAVRKAVDPNFVADVEDILADLPNAEQVKDEVWQRYLESLPDMSVRKSRIHRKGRAGFNADAVRAFGHHMFHGSHQLARMAHSMDLEDALDQAKDDARTSKDPKRSSLIVNEMEKRHQFIMNPTGGALAQWASSFAFVWYLAGSPKAAIMNLFQTPIMATPILGAYAGGLNGVARAGKELIKAAIDFTKGKGFAGHSSSLTAEERQAMADGYETGVIERTQGHDLAGVGETGVEYSAARERAMKIISWGFHHTERMNREVTFLAAYRLARTKGLSHEAAVGKAGELTWKSHYDYSRTSTPRLMHSDTMKVLLVFRNFQINMLYRLFRDVHQAVNGESKEVRREALTHLVGITGMMMLNAGITGTWLFGIAMVMAGLFMEDGEEPDEEIKKAMIKVLGPRLAGMALHGLPGYITGTSLSGSVGMPDLWFRSPDSEKEGEEALQYWQSQLLGAVPGIAAQFVSGWDKIKKGEEYRGIETMMPKMFKDPMKAYRYMTEGAKNMRGDTVAEVTNPDVIKQALGFTPARIAEQYKINNASYNLQQTIMKERKRIMDDYYKADQDGDEAKVNELIKKIEKYNEKNPEQAITPRSIIQSRKNRDKGAENAVGGMRYNSKLRDRLMEEQAPNIYGE